MVVHANERDAVKKRITQLIPQICCEELKHQDEFSIEALIAVRFPNNKDVLLVTINDNFTNQHLPATATIISPEINSSVAACDNEDHNDDGDDDSKPVEPDSQLMPQETVMEWKDEDEAQILIPKQEGSEVVLPQKLWELLQQGRCTVRNTPDGQLITAPASYILPHFNQLMATPSTPCVPDHTYRSTKDARPETHKKYSKPGKSTDDTASSGRRGRPLKQPDPVILAAYDENIAPDDPNISGMIQDGQITILNHGDVLPESVQAEVVITESKARPKQTEFKCDICQKVLGSARSLQWHIQGLHAPPSHKCVGCGENFPFPLKQQKCHSCSLPGGQPRAYRCLSCNRVFKHRFLLMRHRAACVSDDKASVKEALQQFMIIEEGAQDEEEGEEESVTNEVNDPEVMIECNQCKAKFDTQKELKVHLKQCQPNAVQCSGCGSMFDNFTLLKHHKKFCQSVIRLTEPKTPRQFICQYCARVYDTSSKLTDHIKGVHCEPSLFCSCGAAFKWRSSLNKHKEKCPYSRPEDGKTPRKPPRIKVAGEEHQCPYCQITYRSDSGLRTHIQVKHKQTAAFRCTICSSLFATRSALSKHRDRCPPQELKAKKSAKNLTYKCRKCEATFKKKLFLEKHIIGMHLPGKRYQCNLCGMKFRWNGGLGRHRSKCKKNAEQPTELVTEVIQEYTVVTELDNEQQLLSEPMETVIESSSTSLPTTTVVEIERIEPTEQERTTHVEEVVLKLEPDPEPELNESFVYVSQGEVDTPVAAAPSNSIVKIEQCNADGSEIVFECSLEDALAAKIEEGTELSSEQVQQIIRRSEKIQPKTE